MNQTQLMLQTEPYAAFLAKYSKSEASVIDYAGDLFRWDRFIVARSHGPLEATPVDCSDFFNDMMKRHVSEASMQRVRACLRKFYKGLVAQQLLKEDPTPILDTFPLKASKPNPKALDPEDRQKLLQSLKWNTHENWQKSMVILFGMQMGLRRFEIAKIKIEDFDLKNKRFKVLGKGRKHASLPIPSMILEHLKDYPSEVYLFENGANKHHSKETIALWVKWVGKNWCGWDKKKVFSTHILRHIFCSMIAEAKTPVEIAVKLTRHSNIQTYIANYVKVQEKAIDEASQNIFG